MNTDVNVNEDAKESSPKRQRTDLNATVSTVRDERVSTVSTASSVAQLVTIIGLLTTLNLATNEIKNSLDSIPSVVAKTVCKEWAPTVATTETRSRIDRDLKACSSVQEV